MKKLAVLSFLILFIYIATQEVWAAFPASASYKLQDYGFGAGGTATSSSSNYTVNGTAGQVEYGRPASGSYQAGGGIAYENMANVPGAPTLSTPANNYDRIKFVLNTSGNTSDTTYALQISTTSNFSSGNNYIKADGTLGTSLTTTDYKTYTSWGGSSGSFVTGLQEATTYYIRAKARKGNFTESAFGPAASLATNNSSITFSLDNTTLTFSALSGGNSYTDAGKTTILTTTTNAYNGYVVYAKETQPLTSEAGTIPDFSGTNAIPTTWSGTGFGYTTSDTSLVAGGIPNRFVGSKYAGFVQTSATAGDPVADHVGPVDISPISNEQFTISYRVTADNLTPSGTYHNVILYTIVPSF